MNRFEWVSPRTLDEARDAANATVPQVMAERASAKTALDRPAPTAVFKAGGTDLLDSMKEGICAPDKVVSILGLPGLNEIAFDKTKGLQLGALTRLAELEENEQIRMGYRALHEAAGHAATPQIRNMATLGGNLAQRPRCWYFRSSEYRCLKRGGDTCYALEGQNEIHAIFGNQTCAMVPATSVATALVALNATVRVASKNQPSGAPTDGKSVPLASLYIVPETDVTRETTLQPGELIVGVDVPVLPQGSKTAYYKQAAKESYDWALVDAAVNLTLEGDRIAAAVIVCGAVAPVPYRATAAERYLVGKTLDEATAREAGKLATEGATPLSKNKYKVPMLAAVVSKCLLNAA